MTSQEYIFYCIDSAGRLLNPEWLWAETDEHAVRQVEALHPNAECEIWQGKRLVAKLSARRLSA